MKYKKRIETAVLFALIFTLIISFSGFKSGCNDLKSNVLRLHIIANSDSAEDQKLKLTVRDAVLLGTKNDFSNCETLEQAVNTAQANIAKITAISEKTLKENGKDYPVTATVKKEFFKTRVYDDFTLPAGEYMSLCIRIGEAKGHNWWCIIFPGICIPSSSETTLSKSVGKDGYEISVNSNKYLIRFKILEFFESIKYKLKK